MSEQEEVTITETMKGNWTLRQEVEIDLTRYHDRKWYLLKWELIEQHTGVVRRLYFGREVQRYDHHDDPEYCGCLSVEFGDDEEWLLIREGKGGQYVEYRERLPGHG